MAHVSDQQGSRYRSQVATGETDGLNKPLYRAAAECTARHQSLPWRPVRPPEAVGRPGEVRTNRRGGARARGDGCPAMSALPVLSDEARSRPAVPGARKRRSEVRQLAYPCTARLGARPRLLDGLGSALALASGYGAVALTISSGRRRRGGSRSAVRVDGGVEVLY